MSGWASHAPVTFLWPEMLWGLLAVPALVVLYVWLLRRRKQLAWTYRISRWCVRRWARAARGAVTWPRRCCCSR